MATVDALGIHGAVGGLKWGMVSDFLSASREQIFSQHQYWRLFTTVAVHEDLVHFGSNALFFFIFGMF